jgi:hypothetical protein
VIGVGLFPSIIMTPIGEGVAPIAQRIADVVPQLAGR